MGDHDVKYRAGSEEKRAFMRRMLDDLRALERMEEAGLIESGHCRIGAEQEMFLVDENWRPARAAEKLLKTIGDPRFTTEIGLYNLEVNFDPLDFAGNCFSALEGQIDGALATVRGAAAEEGVKVVLAGILPTVRKSDLTLDCMTPNPRYFALNEALSAIRGGAYELHIRGLDELIVKHDSVMLESCNASFQVHFQTDAQNFARHYNIAQAVAAPVLAASVNSPLLFGRQLWKETRIALFQQSVDTRASLDFTRERSPRVTFGNGWVKNSVRELFQEDISRFRTVMTTVQEETSTELLERQIVPKLRSLCVHNSTVYRWNRPCYGLTDGKPHLRIENRVLPAGPTPADEVANAAFWLGLMAGMSAAYEDITRHISFDDAKINFNTAARLGLRAQYQWLDGESLSGTELICDRLLPLAKAGLDKHGIDPADSERYLGLIDERVRKRQTGADWIVKSLGAMGDRGIPADRMVALTAATVERQLSGEPVARWTPAKLSEAGRIKSRGAGKQGAPTVEHYMSTDLFTVPEDETVDLVVHMMDWRVIRHIPVEDARHRLVGLVSDQTLFRLITKGQLLNGKDEEKTVADIMEHDPVTIGPNATVVEAIHLMRHHKVPCLPVVSGGNLVGILSERDLLDLAADLLGVETDEELPPREETAGQDRANDNQADGAAEPETDHPFESLGPEPAGDGARDAAQAGE